MIEFARRCSVSSIIRGTLLCDLDESILVRKDQVKHFGAYMRSLLSLGCCLFLFMMGATSRVAEGATLSAGAASVDISPQTLPAFQNGGFLQAKSGRVVDPLHARSLVISDGSETIAIVIVDSCMLPTPLCDQIKQMAKQETGIPDDRILISATHTHMRA